MRNKPVKTHSDWGKKAENLFLLSKAGFPVPRFITVSRKLKDRSALIRCVDSSLKKIKYFAVRSSASIEDGSAESFAGRFYSAVGVTRERLFEEYARVVASYEGGEGSVIIQELVPSEKAGVIFTNTGEGVAVINASFGLCKSVVEGGKCDEYIVNRKGRIIKLHIEKEKEYLEYDGLEVSSCKVGVSAQVLCAAEIRKILSCALRIERYFGSPQDIEWCIRNCRLRILQSRPITRSINIAAEPVFYDSANIAESYSGVVLPLTLSFAKNLYKTVYENLLAASGVSRKKIKSKKRIFSDMIATFYGRMYYNMNNWYLMMAFAPGYGRNKRNLEEMITSNVREDIAREVAPSVWLRLAYPVILVFKVLFFPITVRGFKRNTIKAIRLFRSKRTQALDYPGCSSLFKRLSDSLLANWHIPVENDFLVMTWYGILRNRIERKSIEYKGMEEMLVFSSTSTNQIDALRELSEAAKKDSALWKAVTEENEGDFCMRMEELPAIKRLYRDYFEKYGGRFANELKLESIDVEEERIGLFRLMKSYDALVLKPKPVKEEKKQALDFITSYVLRKYRQYGSERESLRLLRSNCFAIARKIFRRMGAILKDEGIMKEQSDVFYCTLDELLASGIHSDAGLYRIVEERKAEYAEFAAANPPPFFKAMPGCGPELWDTKASDGEVISGRPCTPGIVTGRVKVFAQYFLPEKIDFDIMVTRHTDPGWTTLIGLSKGLIIEHGGILSHAAIVSRELGIPTVIGVEGATLRLKDGMIVTLNATEGRVEIQEYPG